MPDTTSTSPTTEAAPPNDTDQQGDPAVDDLGENGKKALDSERRARMASERQAKALQAQLDTIQQTQMSDLDRAKKAAEDAVADATAARAEALRYRIAAKFQVTDEDAELFLTGRDEDTLTRQAERLVERNKPGTPKPDPSQGARGNTSAQTTGDLFAAAIEGSFTR